MEISQMIELAAFGFIALLVVYVLFSTVRVVGQQTALIVERLGRFDRAVFGGLQILVPFIDSVTRVTVANTSTGCHWYSTLPARERRSKASMMWLSRVTPVWMKRIDWAMSPSSKAVADLLTSCGTPAPLRRSRRSWQTRFNSSLNPCRLTSGERRSWETLYTNISFS